MNCTIKSEININQIKRDPNYFLKIYFSYTPNLARHYQFLRWVKLLKKLLVLNIFVDGDAVFAPEDFRVGEPWGAAGHLDGRARWHWHVVGLILKNGRLASLVLNSKPRAGEHLSGCVARLARVLTGIRQLDSLDPQNLAYCVKKNKALLKIFKFIQ